MTEAHAKWTLGIRLATAYFSRILSASSPMIYHCRILDRVIIGCWLAVCVQLSSFLHFFQYNNVNFTERIQQDLRHNCFFSYRCSQYSTNHTQER